MQVGDRSSSYDKYSDSSKGDLKKLEGEINDHKISKDLPVGLEKDSFKNFCRDLAKLIFHSIASVFTGGEKTSLGRYHIAKSHRADDIENLWGRYKSFGDDLLVVSRNRPHAKGVKNKEEIAQTEKLFEDYVDFAEQRKESAGDIAGIAKLVVLDEPTIKKNLFGGICKGISVHMAEELYKQDFENLKTDEIIDLCEQGTKGWPPNVAAKQAFYSTLNAGSYYGYASLPGLNKEEINLLENADKNNSQANIITAKAVNTYIREVKELPIEHRPKLLELLCEHSEESKRELGEDQQIYLENAFLNILMQAFPQYLLERLNSENKENTIDNMMEALQKSPKISSAYKKMLGTSLFQKAIPKFFEYSEKYLSIREEYNMLPAQKKNVLSGDDLFSKLVNKLANKKGSKIPFSQFLNEKIESENLQDDNDFMNIMNSLIFAESQSHELLISRLLVKRHGADYKMIPDLKSALTMENDREYLEQVSSLNSGLYTLHIDTGSGGHATTIIVRGEGKNKEFLFHDPNIGLIKCDPKVPHENILKAMSIYPGAKNNPLKKIKNSRSFHNIRIMQYIPAEKSHSINSTEKTVIYP